MAGLRLTCLAHVPTRHYPHPHPHPRPSTPPCQSYSFNFMGQKLGRRVRVLMFRALLRQVGWGWGWGGCRARAGGCKVVARWLQGGWAGTACTPAPVPGRAPIHWPHCAAAAQEVGWFDEDRNASGVLSSKLSSDALAVKGQFGDTMGLLTQVGPRWRRVHGQLFEAGGAMSAVQRCAAVPGNAGAAVPMQPARPLAPPCPPQNLVTFGGGLVVAFINGWKVRQRATSLRPARHAIHLANPAAPWHLLQPCCRLATHRRRRPSPAAPAACLALCCR